ncbi:MAG: prepilin-type cleavage/methylation domain-containing protein [Burkholderiales bacterium PBB3]|nr:MAG: prepilin-type cleavage/methylation domain-containing protein [Burkholderiales bacterium PBB3]
MKSLAKSRQAGFTLVEIAIVLVIIGLLLGGVLKGQEMIENAKIKNLANDMKGVAAAYYAYQDRYKAVPGDDAAASTRFVGAVNGGGNGTITGLYDATVAPAAAAESNNFWQHTRMAGFLSGTATATVAVPPTHALGGFLGVQANVAAASTYGITGVVTCAGAVPWKIAQALDILLDDGNSATGNVRAGAAATPATAVATSAVYGPAFVPTAANTSGQHTVCMKI